MKTFNARHFMQQYRVQNLIFVVLMVVAVALIATVSLRFDYHADWTYGQRNTLTDATVTLLGKLDQPLSFTVFATEDDSVRRPIQDLLLRYKNIKTDLSIKFINPDIEPNLARKEKILANGEVIFKYGDKTEHVRIHNEQSYSNALQRLARSSERWLLFVNGHGEREPHRQANHDLSDWVKILSDKGFKSQTLNLVKTTTIPDNTAVLVIAGPQVDYLSGEVDMIKSYVEQGGNLLWLADPGSIAQLDSIAEALSFRFLPGTIVDPTTKMFGIDDPRFTIVPDYPSHAITDSFAIISLFPQARALEVILSEEWQTTNILRSVERSWAESGELSGKIRHDKAKDIKGPLTLGVAMTRDVNIAATSDSEQKLKQQRVVVVGDGDFLSNSYIGNGGNLDLGTSMINWLSHDDQLVDIPTKNAPDTQYILSSTMQGFIAFFFFLIIPLMFVSCGVAVWLRRRKL